MRSPRRRVWSTWGTASAAPWACRWRWRCGPKKITISKDKPADVAYNLFHGTVREIAYFGSYSSYIVEMAGGRRVKITEANQTRHANSDITWDDKVFFWWDDAAPVTLTQ